MSARQEVQMQRRTAVSALVAWVLLATGCATTQRQCGGTLQPINTPARASTVAEPSDER